MSKRKKAWIGAAIGAVTGIATSLINNAKEKKAKAIEKENAVKEAAFEQASAMQKSLNNNDIDDYYKNKITLKNGGNVVMNRVSYAKKYACGGRKRKEGGGEDKIDTKTNFFKTEEASAAIGAIGNITSSLLTPVSTKVPIKTSTYDFGNGATITPNTYNDRIAYARLGTKHKAKCK